MPEQNVEEYQKIYVRKDDGTVVHEYSVPQAKSWGDAVQLAVEDGWDLTGFCRHPEKQAGEEYRSALRQRRLERVRMAGACFLDMDISSLRIAGTLDGAVFERCRGEYIMGGNYGAYVCGKNITFRDCDIERINFYDTPGAEIENCNFKAFSFSGDCTGWRVLNSGFRFDEYSYVDAKTSGGRFVACRFENFEQSPAFRGGEFIYCDFDGIGTPRFHSHIVAVDVKFIGSRLRNLTLRNDFHNNGGYSRVGFLPLDFNDTGLTEKERKAIHKAYGEIRPWPDVPYADGRDKIKPELLELVEDKSLIHCYLSGVSIHEQGLLLQPHETVIYRHDYDKVYKGPASGVKALARTGPKPQLPQPVKKDKAGNVIEAADDRLPVVVVDPDKIAAEILMADIADLAQINELGAGVQADFSRASSIVTRSVLVTLSGQKSAQLLFAALRDKMNEDGGKGLFRFLQRRSASFKDMMDDVDKIRGAIEKEIEIAKEQGAMAGSTTDIFESVREVTHLYDAAIESRMDDVPEGDARIRDDLAARRRSLQLSRTISGQFLDAAWNMQRTNAEAVRIYRELGANTLPLILHHIATAAAVEQAQTMQELEALAGEINMGMAVAAAHDKATLKAMKTKALSHVKGELGGIIERVLEDQALITVNRAEALSALQRAGTPGAEKAPAKTLQ